jgi:hypothetical protein
MVAYRAGPGETLGGPWPPFAMGKAFGSRFFVLSRVQVSFTYLPVVSGSGNFDLSHATGYCKV